MPKSGQPWDRGFLENEPLFRVFSRFAEPFRTPDWPTLGDYARELENRRLESGCGYPPLGVAPNPSRSRRAKRQSLSLDQLYDGRIALTGQVYCLSESYHDLFNIVIFSAFPLAKRALHTRQFAAVSSWVSAELDSHAPRIPGRRTREQDALTILDEGGVILAMTEERRDNFAQTEGPFRVAPFEPDSGIVPILFGHALLEHLHDEHRAIRASGVIITMPEPWPFENRPEALCGYVDPIFARRIADPTEFLEPKADCIFEMAKDGTLSVRHSSYDELRSHRNGTPLGIQRSP
jgi:hypothetical protein